MLSCVFDSNLYWVTGEVRVRITESGLQSFFCFRMSSKSWQEAVEKERYKTSKKKGKSEMWVRGPSDGSDWDDEGCEEAGHDPKRRKSFFIVPWKWKGMRFCLFFFPGRTSIQRKYLSFISQLFFFRFWIHKTVSLVLSLGFQRPFKQWVLI